LAKIFKTQITTGFTLVELLVVIAIIALLLSILMPALQKMRIQSKCVMCQTRHKQLITASMLWSQDNDNWVLPAVWDRTRKSEGAHYDATPRLAPYVAAAPGTTGKGIFRCPEISEQIASIKDVDGWVVNASYGINLYLCYSLSYTGPDDFWGPESVGFWTHGNIKMYQIKQPSQKIYFADSDMYSLWSYGKTPGTVNGQAVDTYLTNSSPSQKDLGRRHMVSGSRKNAGKANIAWCDGSVSMEPKDFEILISANRGIAKYGVFRRYWDIHNK
jgi:prepilin-type N-terminal cleavage/methylation domain-containing protein/prepilin-type processing-associated H-X9-DG protein